MGLIVTGRGGMHLKKGMVVYDKILTRIENVCVSLSALIALGMAFMVTYSVLGRNFFSVKAAWAVEISEYMMVYIVFLAGAWILRNDGHVSVEVLFNTFPAKVKKHVGRLTLILGAGTSLLFTVYSAKTTIEHYMSGVIIINVIEIPKYLILMIIPIGMGLIFLRFIRKIAQSFGY